MSKAKRRASYRKGLRAELAAAVLLTLKGYRVLARRYRSSVGEIDLVARHGPDGDYDIGFDVVLASPWSWPRHQRDAFRI